MRQDAGRQFNQLPVTALGPRVTAHIRRGGAQQAGCVRQASVGHGCFAGMVMRLLAGFVIAVVVLFIHHDQADVAERGEQCRARTHNDRQVSGAGAPPGVIAFAIGKFRVD